MLEMLKLAPILKEVPKAVCVSGHDGSGSHDGKLHETFALSRRGRRGPESITRKSEMANHNSRAGYLHRLYRLKTSDSAIAAMAMLTKTTLLTRNADDF